MSAAPDLAVNFRAQSWMWFRVCRGCSELFDTSETLWRMRDKARQNGAPVKPRKYCTDCVFTIIKNWSDDD